MWSNILKIYCNSELIWTDLVLLKKSSKSGRVKIKIAKVTTNGTRRLNWTTRQNGHLWPIFGGILGVRGLKYICPPTISPLGKYMYIHMLLYIHVCINIYVWMNVLHVHTYIFMSMYHVYCTICIHTWYIHVWMYECMYVCMYD